MRFSLLILVALLSWGATSARATPVQQPVAVKIELREGSERRAVWVDMIFQGDADGRTVVRLPDRFGYATDLWLNVTEVSVDGGRIASGDGKTLTLDHAPSATLHLRYRVKTGERASRGLGVEAGPAEGVEGVSFLGETVIAYPEGRLDASATVRLGPMPAGWTLASDLEAGGETTLREARESYLLAGPAVRIVERRLPDGSRLRVALRGAFDFSDDAVANNAARLVAYQRLYWNAPPKPFLITIDQVPVPDVMVWGGQGRGADSMALYASRAVWLDKFTEVLAHEITHAWLARALGGLPAGADEPKGYWFSEGFADYLGYRSLVKSGVFSPADFETALSGHAWSTPINAERMKTDYWHDRELFEWPYFQGFNLALRWDERLRTSGKTALREVLLTQAKQAAAGGSQTADALFPKVYAEVSGLDLSADIERYVTRGEPAQVPSTIARACDWLPPADPPRSGIVQLDPDACVAAAFGSGI
jgi:predicted metalloprotease with PDZ domain